MRNQFIILSVQFGLETKRGQRLYPAPLERLYWTMVLRPILGTQAAQDDAAYDLRVAGARDPIPRWH